MGLKGRVRFDRRGRATGCRAGIGPWNKVASPYSHGGVTITRPTGNSHAGQFEGC